MKRRSHAAIRRVGIEYKIGTSSTGTSMTRITCLALALLLAACAEAPPRSSSACIPGDPAGPPACQAFTYSMAR
jgi:hypothetical protein